MSINEKLTKAIKLSGKGDTKGAQKLLEEIIAMKQTSPKVHAALGSTYWDLEEFDRAITHFNKATELAPDWEDASLGLFHCLWDLGKREEALEEAKRFMAIGTSIDYENIIKEINEKI